MPTLDFKGKQHIYAHHLAVPYRPLIPDVGKSATQNISTRGGGVIPRLACRRMTT